VLYLVQFKLHIFLYEEIVYEILDNHTYKIVIISKVVCRYCEMLQPCNLE